jgi:hypothetical protein
MLRPLQPVNALNIPALTAVLVILAGIIGALAVTALMNLGRVGDFRARAFCGRARLARHRHSARFSGRRCGPVSGGGAGAHRSRI